MIINDIKKCIYYNKNENIIFKAFEFIIEKSESNYIEIYVHNINFDGLIILNEISKEKINFSIRFLKENIYFIEIFFLNKTIKFRCSYKIIPLSLKILGKIENEEKGVFPYKFVSFDTLFYIGKYPDIKYWEKGDFSYLNENKIFDLKKETMIYCLKDVIITQKVLKKILDIIYIEDKNIIKKCFSAGSLSHNLFYIKYNYKNIEKNIKKIDEIFIRESYFGGRCEIFGNIFDDEHVKYFDFSGMYGQCMEEEFHTGCGTISYEESWEKIGFHKIEYESYNNYMPILPTKSQNKKLIFANGINIGTFWYEEIKLFKKKGGKIIRVIESFIYEKKEKVFDNFILNFNNIRKKGGYYKIFGKLMINSLYGGMGLKDDDTYNYITFSKKEYDYINESMDVLKKYEVNSTYILSIEKNYKSKIFLKKKNIKEDDKSKRNVSYSSAIASKARIKLYNAMEGVENNEGRVLYCDTDSIFAAYKNNNLEKKNGDIEWISFYKDAVFAGAKTYALKSEKDEIKIKGIKNGDIKFEEFKDFFYNEKTIKFKDQLNFKKNSLNIEQIYLEKEIDFGLYDKRIFIDKKKKKIPINLNIKKK